MARPKLSSIKQYIYRPRVFVTEAGGLFGRRYLGRGIQLNLNFKAPRRVMASRDGYFNLRCSAGPSFDRDGHDISSKLSKYSEYTELGNAIIDGDKVTFKSVVKGYAVDAVMRLDDSGNISYLTIEAVPRNIVRRLLVGKIVLTSNKSQISNV